MSGNIIAISVVEEELTIRNMVRHVLSAFNECKESHEFIECPRHLKFLAGEGNRPIILSVPQCHVAPINTFRIHKPHLHVTVNTLITLDIDVATGVTPTRSGGVGGGGVY